MVFERKASHSAGLSYSLLEAARKETHTTEGKDY